MTTLRAGSATDVGRIRSANEDSKAIVEASDLYVVADGMGGHQGGEVASGLAVETVGELAAEPSLDNLIEAVRKANRAIFEKAGGDPDLRGMGTTLCAIRVVDGPEGDEIAWVNVGDSRVYLLRDDRLLQLSRDHSLVEDLVRDGQLTEEEAAVHPQRNILTRALGIDVDVDVDGATVIPYNGDRFVLCSDGLFNEVTSDQIASVLRRLDDPDEAADELVRLANEGGGRDNITVVLVDVIDDDGRTLAAAAALAETEGTVDSAADADADADASADAGAPEDPDGRLDGGPVLGNQRSSLPESDDDYGAETDDFFGDLGHARNRRITWRVLAFVLAVLVIGAVVAGSVMFSARNSYYVTFNGGQVALYKGKPGGVLFVDPSLERVTEVKRSQLPQNLQDAVATNKTFSSKADAEQYLVFLYEKSQATATTTTTPSSTTTTAPKTTTTKPRQTTTTSAPKATTTTAASGGP